MGMLLGSIIMLQILAHMPLSDIYIPANARQQFDIMIGVVSFDYFQPTEYIDMGFTDMPAWSDGFDWLGYGSINFVDGMGSIIIFAFVQIMFIILALFLKFAGCCRCCCGWCKRNFDLKKVSSDSLNFIHGTFFEVMVCVSVSMRMLKYEKYFETPDYVSVVLQFFFALILITYVIFVTYFTIFKTGPLQIRSSGLIEASRKKHMKSIHKEILQRRLTNKTSSF